MSGYDVSVLIPAYNAADTLVAAVESALSHEDARVQVCIADDASTDSTFEVMQRLALWPDVKIVRRAENGGVAAAQNSAAEIADGRYFIVLGADDYLEPGCVSYLAWTLDVQSDIGFVYGDSQVFGAQQHQHIAPAQFVVADYYRFFPTWYAFMFRRDAWDAGCRWTDFIRRGGRWLGLQDWDFALQLIETMGYRGMKAHTTVLHYRATRSGMDAECRLYWNELMRVLQQRHPKVQGTW